MSPTVSISKQIAKALRSAPFPSGFHACGFRIDGEIFYEDVPQPLVEVVVILDGDDWNDEVASACQASSAAVGKALGELDLFGMSLCRTREEHQDLAEIEGDLWEMVDVNESCS